MTKEENLMALLRYAGVAKTIQLVSCTDLSSEALEIIVERFCGDDLIDVVCAISDKVISNFTADQVAKIMGTANLPSSLVGKFVMYNVNVAESLVADSLHSSETLSRSRALRSINLKAYMLTSDLLGSLTPNQWLLLCSNEKCPPKILAQASFLFYDDRPFLWTIFGHNLSEEEVGSLSARAVYNMSVQLKADVISSLRSKGNSDTFDALIGSWEGSVDELLVACREL